MDLLRPFLKALRQTGTLKAGDRVVLAVSGGADSLAMLHLFTRARETLPLDLVVLHVHHGIRGAEADADADFVESICGEWQVACRVQRGDSPALAAERKLSLEAAAREVRYAALKDEADRVGAKVVAAAHTLDDQAETVLMHVLRGSGLDGLRGMQRVSQMPGTQLLLIRPLLGITRQEIENYCSEHGLTPRTDSTNTDITYTRNRLRHDVIPLLEQINPQAKSALARLAKSASADVDWLIQEVERAWQAVVLKTGEGHVQLDRESLSAQPPALQRRLIRRAAEMISGTPQDIGFDHVEAALDVALNGSTGVQAILPGGIRVRLAYGEIVIEKADQPEAYDHPQLEASSCLPLTVPGQIDVGSWHFIMQPYDGPRSGDDWQALLSDRWSAMLALPGDPAEIVLRTRRPGDRFTPQGAGGSQKLGDFMTDHKIPAAWRDHLPLLEINGQIAWVCGWRVDQRFVVSKDSTRILIVKFTPKDR